MEELKPKTVVEWLNTVNYGNDDLYIPSEFALNFINFIKLVNDGEGEENKSPVLHYKMLDQIATGSNRVANLVHRGAAKTTLLAEYLFLYLGFMGGKLTDDITIEFALYVSDSIDNGVKNMKKNLKYRWENSDFLQKYIPHVNLIDTEWTFKNLDGDTFIVKGYGVKALSLDSKLFTESGYTTIKDVKVGDKIFGADGKLTRVTKKSEIFYENMYKITLKDGRELKVSEEHINSIIHKEIKSGQITYTKKDLLTEELIDLDLQHIRKRKRKNKPDYISKEDLVFIQNCCPLEYEEKELLLDPYVLGLLLGDGSIRTNGSNILHAHKDDMKNYIPNIPYELGSLYTDKRNSNVQSLSIKGLSEIVRQLEIVGHGNLKKIPDIYLRGSIEQRLELLRGLMDTDGTVSNTGRTSFCSNSEKLVDGLIDLVLSLGGSYSKRKTNNAYKVEIWIDYNPFKLQRKSKLYIKGKNKGMSAIVSIERIDTEHSQCIAVDNLEHQFIAESYFRTHNTGVRGTKAMGKRPKLAVLDDLISDDDARSPTVIQAVEEVVYKGVDYALHTQFNMIIWSGTPFNANDPLYKAVESGAWDVNVYPVCEQFPCSREEFRGSWEDRFTYDFVKGKYDNAMKAGRIDTFNQELMLRIMSDEDRLINDDDIKFYNRGNLISKKDYFNFYITTDFATSEKDSADFSVISVWALNNQGSWFWVDGICSRNNMATNLDELFRLVSKYKPQGVGVEVSGQQGGFIPWINQEMMNRNVYFNLQSIRPTTGKLARFNVVVPLFKAGKVFFPNDMPGNKSLEEGLLELSLASNSGFKSKNDDFLDTISMLALLNNFRPSETVDYNESRGVFNLADYDDDSTSGNINSYIV